jgi:hypothetical protein
MIRLRSQARKHISKWWRKGTPTLNNRGEKNGVAWTKVTGTCMFRDLWQQQLWQWPATIMPRTSPHTPAIDGCQCHRLTNILNFCQNCKPSILCNSSASSIKQQTLKELMNSKSHCLPHCLKNLKHWCYQQLPTIGERTRQHKYL